ncbi:MAG: hypothetical protein ABEJ26_11140 [Halosimplex sp.]
MTVDGDAEGEPAAERETVEGSTGAPDDDREPPLSPATRSSLLWGVVGGLSFLVLVQGYELLAEVPVGLGAKFGIAALVAVGAAGLTYALGEGRSAPEGER